ncbi:non-ribosomal peptide synthetase [Nocardia vermiculata]|uniref:Non-ribosomal peptide synthetase n=1 Tax=Nocardia vermiculata TaxID=257274 RepID=A0A846Y3H4_9NOCA|nr:non-ribosomal peptide synthetase [Nocardia vermiculata]NKY52500.1 non-ribosomal peptide synthetase [Nocardia vermiculata]
MPTLLSAAAAQNPDGVAVVDGAVSMTYRELDRWSSRVARLLIDRGIGPEDMVAVGIPRSRWSVAAAWAVTKTGAAFVPVDPRYPSDRIAYLLSDSRAVLGLTVTGSAESMAGEPDWLTVDTDQFEADLSHWSAEPVNFADRVRRLHGAHPAYVMYTSGSTGRPKGVVVTHAGLANYCVEQRDQFAVTDRSRTLHIASPSFDVSVGEFLLAFGAAATMVIAPADVFGGAELAELLRRERVTHVTMTPAALTTVDPTGLDELRVIGVIGEACPPELVTRWATEIPGGRREFYNTYGPTEATIVTHVGDPLAPGAPVTIGRPVRGMTSRILDDRLAQTAPGQDGELYLAGPGLARGYLRRPDLSADRFVADPYGPPGSRMYRTGDLARTTADGLWEYLGRNDFQVKIRGFRIELGEIDSALVAHPEIHFAVTIGRRMPSGETLLVGYVVPEPGAAPDPEQLREFAARTLPVHMVPPVIMLLEQLPLTPVGKLDRTALPEPPLEVQEYRAPETGTEQVVATAIAGLLGLERVGLDDDFFALGGNSLLAVRAAAWIGGELGVRVPPRTFFTADTVAELADAMSRLTVAERPRLIARSRPDPMPVSAAQQRLWLTNQFDTASAAYNIPFALRLTGAVDVQALRAAVADVIERHEPLRTLYSDHDGEPVQVVLPVPDAMPELVVETVAAEQIPERLTAIAAAGFDLRSDLPVRASLFQPADNEYVLALVMHHIACDGTSFAPLARDVVAAYQARTTGAAPEWRPLTVTYADYVLWEREVLGPETDEDSLAATQARYWQQQLAAVPDGLELPLDRPRPPVWSGRGATVDFELNAEVTAGLRRVADEHDASLFMVVHAALAVLLARLSGSADIAIGTQISGRGAAELDDVVGMFGNTLVLRTDVDGAQPFGAFLDGVRETDLAAMEHAELNIDRVVDLVRRGSNRAPLFQVLLMLQNFEQPRIDLPQVSIEQLQLDVAVAKLDLSVTLTEQPDGQVAGVIDYATDLFDHATVAAMARRFVAIASEIGRDETVAVGDIALLTADEHALLAALAGPQPTSGTVLDGFLAQVSRTPHAPAVVFGEQHWSYGEFAGWVNRLARHLLSLGVGPEVRVAVAMRRSPDMLAAIYAVLVAGGAYVPLDPDHPAQRTDYILDVVRPAAVLTTGDSTTSGDAVRCDELDLSRYSPEPVTDAERRRPLRPSNAAYTLFTSGSTGRPKGVVVTHRSVVNQLAWMREQYDLGPADTLLHKTPVTFDASVWELLLPLAVGARLVIAPHDGHLDPAYLVDTMHRYRVAMVEFVPSMLALLLDDEATEFPDALRYFSLGGEELPVGLLDRVRQRHPAVVDNTYGPTEATVTSTVFRCAGVVDGRVPIGRPIRNTGAAVLDSRLHPVPPGVPGELYLSGVQLARGYEGASAQTAARFVADPSGRPGARRYRTGDLVRMRRDGTLEFLGRTDFQVKLRGLRIELGEIEAALVRHPAVARAVVTVQRPERTGELLAAYVVPETGATIDTLDLIERARKTLPEYMIPHHIVVLERLPLTPSGKLDRRALPVIEAAIGTPRYRAPVTAAEHTITAVFAELLGVEQVGADDDFFELGGNSLIGMRVVARVNAAQGTGFGVRDLFEAPTAALLGARADCTVPAPVRPQLATITRPQHLPLSFAQRRMWFLNRLAPGSAAYSIPLAVRLSGTMDGAALAAAAVDVLDRHEALRTRYPSGAEGPYQDIVAAARVPLTLEPENVEPEQVPTRIAEIAGAGFDVTAEVPLRTALLRLAPDDHVLVLVVHHINADGYSMGPLARDLALRYAARATGDTPTWAPLPVQYADYTLWQREVLGDEDDPDSLAARQIAYWTEALAGIPDQLELPADRPRPAVASQGGAVHRFVLSPESHRDVKTLAAERHSTTFAVVHAAFAVLLARLSGTEDVVVGTPIAGRGAAELDDLVGMFVNTLVLRAAVAPDASFADLLTAVTGTDLAAFDHADLPFERLVEILDPPRTQAHSPLFQNMLVLQNQQQPRLDLDGLSIELLPADTGVSPFDLSLTLTEQFDAAGDPVGIIGELTYATDLFDHGTMVALAGRYERILAAVGADPHRVVGDIDVRTDGERQATVLRGPDQVRGDQGTVLDLFHARVATDPDAVAVVDHVTGQQLTYAELATRVHRSARGLVARGIGAERLVALGMQRSLDFVVAAYAVLEAGAGYVPLDLDQPAERIRYILETAAPACVLIDTAGEFPVGGVPIVPLAELDSTGPQDNPGGPLTDAERVAPLRSSNTAYVLFTSGSTGRPKGVVVPHAAVHDQIRWLTGEYGIDADDVVLFKTPATFDVSVWELFGPLAVGARMIVAAPDGHRDPQYLAEVISAEQVTMTSFVPSMLTVFAGSVAPAAIASLRSVLVAGEALTADTVAAFRRVGTAELFNLYGPTEFTVHATHARVGTDVAGAVPIGRPVTGTEAWVLDSRLHPVPVGVPGELYLAGAQAARGYLGRADSTAAAFVANPYAANGSRMYRTGDLVRRGADGQLTYLGRTDFQVKLRGVRIELGEVESVLAGHESVQRAVAVVRSDAQAGDRLVAYAVPAVAGAELDVEALRAHLSARLPAAMVPATIMELAAMPLTANGKLDRKALPAPVFEAAVYQEPVTAVQRAVAEVFGEVLGVERVGLGDNFFELGGTSLIAGRVLTLLGERLRIRPRVQWIFAAPTVAGLAEQLIDAAGPDTDGDGLGVLLPLRTEGSASPLLCVHPMIGLSWSYAALTEQVPDRPLYGLQSPVISEPDTPAGTVEELVTRYVAAIRQVQPHGPYQLLGWSRGGVFAHAIATRLQAEGESVPTLVMLDSTRRTDPARFRAFLTDTLREVGIELGADDELAALSDEQFALLLDFVPREMVSLTPDQVRRMYLAAVASIERDYRPGIFDGDLVYVTPELEPEPDGDGPSEWFDYVSGTVTEHHLPSTHSGMLDPGVVDTLGALLREVLR